MIEKIIQRLKVKMNFMHNNKGDYPWYKGHKTYYDALIEEAEEVKKEIKDNNSVYLEDELGDVFWDFYCLAYALELEGKITSVDKVFERCYKKLIGRVAESGDNAGDWQEVKKLQKEELKKEHESLYGIQEGNNDSSQWQKLYDIAKSKLNPTKISKHIDIGGVASAILTKNNSIYTGVCIDTSCSLGMCAERNAIANMLTNGENEIVKLVCVMWDGSIVMPCGACREYLMELRDDDNGEIEILTNLESENTIKLKELIPDWWGYKYT